MILAKVIGKVVMDKIISMWGLLTIFRLVNERLYNDFNRNSCYIQKISLQH